MKVNYRPFAMAAEPDYGELIDRLKAETANTLRVAVCEQLVIAKVSLAAAHELLALEQLTPTRALRTELAAVLAALDSMLAHPQLRKEDA